MSNVEILNRKKLISKMSMEFAGVPVIGLGEDWGEGLLAITADKQRAKRALKLAADENYLDGDCVSEETMVKKTSSFEYDPELFGGDGGWQFSDNPKAPKITYWRLML